MSDKPKFPRADALKVASHICRILEPVTDRLIIAGSLRRGKELVGDIEFLFIPKHIARTGKASQAEMFESSVVEMMDIAAHQIDILAAVGFLLPCKTVTGSVTWGPKNKYAVHVASGIPCDFFSATSENWWNYLVCRTGPADSNTRIASEAQRKGWQWKPYTAGFLDEQNNLIPVASEEDVFRLVGLPYTEPRDRV